MAMEFTSENFQAEVLDSNIPVLVDFWAPWCGPCKMLGPVIEELAVEYNGKVKIGKVNVDSNRELALEYGVASIPSLKFFKEGRIVDEAVGLMPADRLRAMIEG